MRLIGQVIQRWASARACDVGWLRPLLQYREPPDAYACVFFPADGFGAEYGGEGGGCGEVSARILE